jgi:hypothetical protein
LDLFSTKRVQEKGGSDAPVPPHRPTSGRRAVSARAVLIGLAGAALLCALTPSNDFKLLSTYIAGTQFPMGALWVEVLLVAVNAVLCRRDAVAFTHGGFACTKS